MSSTLRFAALAYSARGIPVLPCRPLAKIPLTPHGVKDATTEAATIETWWNKWPDANIGFATGKSSGLLAIDVDPRHDGERGLRLLDDEAGPLPATLWQRTPSGGRHLIFRLPDAAAVGCKVSLFPGIDVRADGGYIIAAPSRTDVGAYMWGERREPTEAPEALIALLTNPALHSAKPTSADTWATLATNGVGEGARNDAIARVAGHVLRHHVNPYLALAMIQAWNSAHCRPPLDPAEVERTVESIAAKELRRRRQA